MLNKIKNNIKDIQTESKRKSIFKELNSDTTWKYYIDNNRIICKPENIENLSYLLLDGIDTLNINEDELNNYNLNKPIQYLIKDTNFKNPLTISSVGNATILFQNCKFYQSISIENANDIILYNSEYNYKKNESFTIDSKNVHTITLSYENTQKNDAIFSIKLNANKINILHSSLLGTKDKDCPINLNCEKLRIYDSEIITNKLEINANEYIAKENYIISNNESINIRTNKVKRKERLF